MFGSGLDNQRAVTVKSTFLQNRNYLDFYYREAYTVVEMEAGPFCNAVYEIADADRYPQGEAVNFAKLPIDLGIIHYASDTPYSQARTLGARGLSYYGAGLDLRVVGGDHAPDPRAGGAVRRLIRGPGGTRGRVDAVRVGRRTWGVLGLAVDAQVGFGHRAGAPGSDRLHEDRPGQSAAVAGLIVACFPLDRIGGS